MAAAGSRVWAEAPAVTGDEKRYRHGSRWGQKRHEGAMERDQRLRATSSQWSPGLLLLGWWGKQCLPVPRRVGAEGLES